MNLASLLSENQVVAEMAARDHWPAIVELVDHLDHHDLLQGEERGTILKAFRQREESISTGIGHGVAIPHAFSDKTESVIAAFGRSADGVDFDAIDHLPVHFIVLFIVPREQYQLHLRTLAAIAKLLNSGEVRSQLLEAPDATEILKVLGSRTSQS